MKTQKVKLSIEDPCNKGWNNMTPNEQGRFCDRCTKTVVDISQMSDEQVVRLISSNPHKLCIHAKTSQLDRYLVLDKTTSIGSLYKFLAGLFILSSTNSFAAPVVPPKIEVVTPTISDQYLLKNILPADSLVKVVEGIVKDENGELVFGAVIKIRDTQLGTVSDLEGKFRFVLSDSLDLNVITLSGEYLGGEINDLTIDRRKPSFVVELVVTYNEAIEGRVIMAKPRKRWQFWK